MMIVLDDARANGLFVNGVAEEEAVRDLFFLRSANGLLMKLFDRSSHSYTILFSFQ
jgi:hypothetical protein